MMVVETNLRLFGLCGFENILKVPKALEIIPFFLDFIKPPLKNIFLTYTY